MARRPSYATISDRDAERFRDEAVLGLIEAQLACLRSRQAGAGQADSRADIASQIRDAASRRRTLLAALDREHESA